MMAERKRISDIWVGGNMLEREQEMAEQERSDRVRAYEEAYRQLTKTRGEKAYDVERGVF